MTRRQLDSGAPRFDVVAALDVLREIISRTDALVHATEHQLERFTWTTDEDSEGDRQLEHLAHLLGAAKEAARAAVTAGDQIAAELAKHQVCA